MQQANNSLQKSQRKFGITAYLSQDSVRAQIVKAVGQHPDQFITSIISAVNANPQLQECTNSSILSAALIGQSLKLSPSPQLGQYYFVPYKNNKTGTKEAQFQIGYRGMYQLAIRSGQFRKLNAMAVKSGELVRYDPLEETIELQLIENEKDREASPTVGYYAFFELINGFRRAMYWSREKMEAHAERYSKGYAAHKGYTFWEKDFDAMAVKTMYRQLLKLAPMSIDMQAAIISDQAVIHPDGTPDYVDAPAVDVEEAGYIEKKETARETSDNSAKTGNSGQPERPSGQPEQMSVFG